MCERNWLNRTSRLIGETALDKLSKVRVAVFGIGGVGSFAAEALVRAGIGHLLFVDADAVDETNINRQLIATRATIGMKKVDVMKKRALEINPEAEIETLCAFYSERNAVFIDISDFDYIVDAIDSVSSKLFLIGRARDLGVPIISAMGAGNKLDPTAFRVADIYQTSVCPLAKVMRRELKKRSIDKLNVVYSEETPITPDGGGRIPASISFVPPAAGLAIASAVVKDLIEKE